MPIDDAAILSNSAATRLGGTHPHPVLAQEFSA
jgi:hypothetical protein